ncbi:MAG TPA: ABC transporter substrate-binding protein [Negativicutes bacterium]|jgi:NitT/TauT family transport system substrate-binding protein
MTKKKFVLLLIVLVCVSVFIVGCGQKAADKTNAAPQGMTSQATAMKSNKINLGHTGAVCEAPFFIAYEKGFFKEEGLDVTLIQGDGDFRKEGVATGKLDATDSVLQAWLMPIKEGMDINITTGIHTGCMDIVVPASSPIQSIKDLKGRTIGVSGSIGSGPHMFGIRALLEVGLTDKDATWKAYPNPQLLMALERNEIEAATMPDTLAEMWTAEGKTRVLTSMAVTAPFSDETCCHLVVNGERLRNDPVAITKLSNAVIKAAKWVSENREEAVQIMLDKKYTQGNKELNLRLLNTYKYQTDNVLGKKAVRDATEGFKSAGIFPADFDTDSMLKKVYVDLPGLVQ